MVRPGSNVNAHFAKSAAVVRATYDAIVAASRSLGPVKVAPKKTSIHLVRGSAFAGIATRKDALILTVKTSGAIRSPRVLRTEQLSARRWYIELRLRTPRDIDAELRSWLAAAYDLSA